MSVLVAASSLEVAPEFVSAAEGQIPDNAPLLTRWAKNVPLADALAEYQRPHTRRERWPNLNGLWECATTSKAHEKVRARFDGRILVPFPIESVRSGVMQRLKPDRRLWYRRSFPMPDDRAG